MKYEETLQREWDISKEQPCGDVVSQVLFVALATCFQTKSSFGILNKVMKQEPPPKYDAIESDVTL